MAPTTRVLTALKDMCANQIPAVAVVSGNGRLIGNFSASNLKVCNTALVGA